VPWLVKLKAACTLPGPISKARNATGAWAGRATCAIRPSLLGGVVEGERGRSALPAGAARTRPGRAAAVLAKLAWHCLYICDRTVLAIDDSCVMKLSRPRAANLEPAKPRALPAHRCAG